MGALPSLARSQVREFIFAPGSAPFASSHASTLVELEHGTLMAAWFGGTAEGEPDVAIWGAQRRDGHWTAPRLLVREEHIACWNPVLFHVGHRLWLYYKFGATPSTWTAGRLSSDDEGQTWSTPEHLPAGLTGPIRAKPLILPDGTIVSGSSVESYHSWAAWVERSTDQGATWTKFGPSRHPARAAPTTAALCQPRLPRTRQPHPTLRRTTARLSSPALCALHGEHRSRRGRRFLQQRRHLDAGASPRRSQPQLRHRRHRPARRSRRPHLQQHHHRAHPAQPRRQPRRRALHTLRHARRPARGVLLSRTHPDRRW